MERKFEIPKMKVEQIAKWYDKIKPIVKRNGVPVYLAKLSIDEIIKIPYTRFNKDEDYADVVDYSKLSVLADVKMLHTYGYYKFFKPSIGEVIRQIPKELLEKVVAFEMLGGELATNSIFRAEFYAGYHVSVVRLYQLKDITNEEAKPAFDYPNNTSKTPIGITDEQFQNIKPLFL
jgi:hypothetical protein